MTASEPPAPATSSTRSRAELAGAVGLSGRDRPAASSAERARVSVTKAIRTAIKRIAEHEPGLAQHLDQAITTGALCRYDPPERDPVDWQLVTM